MSNYPDDIHAWDNHPDSPFFDPLPCERCNKEHDDCGCCVLCRGRIDECTCETED